MTDHTAPQSGGAADHPGEASRSHTLVTSPIGTLTLVAADGLLCGLYLDGQSHRPDHERFGVEDGAPFAEAVSQLGEYFAGERMTFDLPLLLEGSPFQRRVWSALRDIPYGQTRSYGELAVAVDAPGAARAVGLANGRNPIAIIVPCHRVVGASGKLTGYAGGLERKRYLLELERGPTLLSAGAG